MSLAEKFSRFFAAAVRDRGATYYRQGKVYLKSVDDQRLDARVRGSESYKVLFKAQDKEIQVSCTCPYFDEDFCKHIWATLLEAAASGRFSMALNDAFRLEFMDDGLSYGGKTYDINNDDDFYNDDDDVPYRLIVSRPKRAAAAKPARQANWAKVLDGLQESSAARNRRSPSLWPAEREVFYTIDVEATVQSQSLIVELWVRDRKKQGDWGKLQRLSLSKEHVAQTGDTRQQEIFSRLLGAGTDPYNYYSYNLSRFKLYHPAQTEVVRLMCLTGRCHLKLSASYPSQAAPELESRPLAWDDGEAWQFCLRLGRDDRQNTYFAAGELRRGAQTAPITEPVLLVAGGLIFWSDRVAPLDDSNAFQWISLLRREGRLTIPEAQRDAFFEKLILLPTVPPLELPDELAFTEASPTPTPLAIFKLPKGGNGTNLPTELHFDYDGAVFKSTAAERGVFDSRSRTLILRDTAFEQQAEARLKQLGCRSSYDYWRQAGGLELNRKKLPHAVKTLLQENWRVEAEGKLYRQAGSFRLQVASGIDWFGVNGEMQFGEISATLPALLEALRRGENTVLLDDGTFGILPEDWLQKYRVFAGLGEPQDGELRFTKSQAGLLDALLASQPEASFDAGFVRVRDELLKFTGVEAVDAPPGFTGELRDYQRQGLGWLRFLQQFGFGGCLADDMGLGKTIEVLSLLEFRRELRAAAASREQTVEKTPTKPAKTKPAKSAAGLPGRDPDKLEESTQKRPYGRARGVSA